MGAVGFVGHLFLGCLEVGWDELEGCRGVWLGGGFVVGIWYLGFGGRWRIEEQVGVWKKKVFLP